MNLIETKLWVLDQVRSEYLNHLQYYRTREELQSLYRDMPFNKEKIDSVLCYALIKALLSYFESLDLSGGNYNNIREWFISILPEKKYNGYCWPVEDFKSRLDWLDVQESKLLSTLKKAKKHLSKKKYREL